MVSGPRSKPIRPYAPRPGSTLELIIPDIHFPKHDRAALGCVIGALRLLLPKRVGFLGDVMDCEGFTSHTKLTRAEDRAETYAECEVAPTRRLLSVVEESCDEVWFLEGNHENMVERKLVDMGDLGREIADLVSPRKLLSEGRQKPFHYVDYVQRPGAQLPHWRIAKDLVAVHGWSFAKHVAAKHVDIARNFSVVFGHVHRQQSYMARQPIDGRLIKAWSPGCVAQLQPLYMRHQPSDHVHGFSLVWVTLDGERWTEYTVTIKDGECILPDGRKVNGRDWASTVKEIEKG